ncbi:MAG: tRNA uridine-5-carboxymethylaminomethyl(34) synthesis enzyme MnmG [Erysipelotrichales bacterium]|nr:tRNA uridine-5-carboxymethylaminomethyl(34) synthesis enzyme MnmG [Erysipelotrichales bacterium]
MNYDVIVVGGGHAGCEAAHASAMQGVKTALITSNIKNIADMPCNPSIGGTAKGIVVREIDALGGLMGRVADISHLQIKMLNSGKGPAVKSLRAQGDKIIYPQNMVKELKSLENLTIIEAMVEDLIVENNEIKGIITQDNISYFCDSLILTTGTYLKSKILVGSTNKEEGPHGETSSKHLSDKLKNLGFEIQRLKTGTPPRLNPETVDFSKLKEECGDQTPWTFSFDLEPQYDVENQEKCYLVYTNENTHQIIKDNLTKSAMYGGYAEGIGPRYCPSIEDKIVRFADKERHQLFLEPESKFYPDLYLQGFSTSMPEDVQEKMVHSLVGLENAEILKYAYAIEYDAINPLQMYPSLESKIIKNLYTAGQINGTSGYEEAAGQGLIAGINAGLKIKGKEPLILKRNESYIGVLIDDLVTKGTEEPYRLLTSRAEYRLILRHDNADLRLRKYGYEVGLITEEQYNRLLNKEKNIDNLTNDLKNTKVHPKEINNQIKEALNIDELQSGMSLYDLLKRPEIKMEYLKDYIENIYPNDIFEIVEIAIKYEGYIAKTNREVEKMLKLESKKIPKDIDYNKIRNLASEAKQKLDKIRPETVAQATRISGVNPSDIAILTVYLKKEYSKDE